MGERTVMTSDTSSMRELKSVHRAVFCAAAVDLPGAAAAAATERQAWESRRSPREAKVGVLEQVDKLV